MEQNGIIIMDDHKYRIGLLNNKSVTLVQMEIDSYNIKIIPTDYLKLLEKAGKAFIVEPENRKIINLSPKLEALMADFDEILRKYSSDWTIFQSRRSIPEMKKITDKHNISTSTFHRKLRKYMQSGCNPIGLIDTRTFVRPHADISARASQNSKASGRKTLTNNDPIQLTSQDIETMHKYFVMFDRMAESGMTVKDIYLLMIENEYHSDKNANVSINEIPSERRFRYHLSKYLGNRSIEMVKKGIMASTNDNRLIPGNSRDGVFRAGQLFEMDELEIDLECTSSLVPGQVVGRAILYLLVDVYSAIIISHYVSFHNNSYVGMSGAFNGLLQPHSQVAKSKYGLSFTDNLYPSMVIPECIRTDEGSEYESDEAERMLRELRIHHDICPPGTGSYKGIVEQAFHEFHCNINSCIVDKGKIQKKVNSNHLDTALLTIEDVDEMVYHFILNYNQHLRSERFPLDKQAIDAGVRAIPCELWSYSVNNNPIRTVNASNRDSLLYAMLKTDIRFTVSRSGITAKKLTYYSNDPYVHNLMYDAKDKRITLKNVRYDPHSIDSIYLLTPEKTLLRVGLNNSGTYLETFGNMSWITYLDYYNKEKKGRYDYKEQDLNNNLAMRRSIKSICERANDAKGVANNNPKNITVERSINKEVHTVENSIAEVFDIPVSMPESKPPILGETVTPHDYEVDYSAFENTETDFTCLLPED